MGSLTTARRVDGAQAEAPVRRSEADAARDPSQRFAEPRTASGGRVVQRKCACGGPAPPGGECDECRRRRLQRRATDADGTPADRQPAGVDAAIASPGEALAPGVRGLMERRFAHDFSGVRVHAGPAAAASARALRAHAYTVGSHVMFADGRYAPHTLDGQRLIAHELTHVIQQRSGRRALAGGATDHAEAEALHNEARVHSGGRLVAQAAPPRLARRGTTVEVQAPAGAPGCTLDQHRKIAPAAGRAIGWLDRALDELRAFVANPASPESAATGQALQQFFSARDATTARRVLERVELIRHDIEHQRGAPEFETECHDETDDDCTGNVAYVHFDRTRFVFCPGFFDDDERTRASSIVHEMAHAIISSGDRITDRAYESDRLLRRMPTPEALTNAESYAQLIETLATGRAPRDRAPQDEVQRGCRDIEGPIRMALARAQRWNAAAEDNVLASTSAATVAAHLGADTPGLRQSAHDIYEQAVPMLRSPFDIRCKSDCGGRLVVAEKAADNTLLGLGIGAGVGAGLGLLVGGLAGAAAGMVGLGLLAGGLLGLGLGMIIGTIVGAATSHGPRLHVCPGWKDQPAPAQARTMLAAIYESLGHNVVDSTRSAALAEAAHDERHPQPTEEGIDRGYLEARRATIQARLTRLRRERDELDARIGPGLPERLAGRRPGRTETGAGNADVEPDVDLDRLRREREAELARIRAATQRTTDMSRWVELTEAIVRLERELQEINRRLAALLPLINPFE